MIRAEAAGLGNHLLEQLAAERNKCQEIEIMAEFHVKSSKMCAARGALAHELQNVNMALERCRQELAVREATLRNGDAQTGDIVMELGELRNFKVNFGQWVNANVRDHR